MVLASDAVVGSAVRPSLVEPTSVASPSVATRVWWSTHWADRAASSDAQVRVKLGLAEQSMTHQYPMQFRLNALITSVPPELTSAVRQCQALPSSNSVALFVLVRTPLFAESTVLNWL